MLQVIAQDNDLGSSVEHFKQLRALWGTRERRNGVSQATQLNGKLYRVVKA